MPDKRSADQRRRDFDSIYDGFDAEKTGTQASRCSQCGVPFCQVYCPLSNNIPDWLRLTAEDRLQEAYQMAAATNTFPEICGSICPQDRLCEGNCVIEQAGHGTVTIGAVEKYVTEKAFDEGWVKPRLPKQELAQSVGIIGAGPGGLAAAEMLRSMGYQVTVYDRYDRPGGLLIYGIPNFKLEKYVVARRIELLEAQGVKFKTNVDIGGGTRFDSIRAAHDSILIATGVYKARELALPGAGLDNVVPALDYLIAANRTGLGDKVEDFENGRLNANGKKVVVIGGGDTAMDCVRTAVRQGATSVKCMYRRDRDNMPGSVREVQNAEEENVEFVWLSAPLALHGSAPGPVTGIRAQQMYLGLPDASGRRTPQAQENANFDMDADLVIKALGFEAEDIPALFGVPELAVTASGTLAVDDGTLMTALDGVFAAGDIVRGASLVVWAIKDGRHAALAMHSYMEDAGRGRLRGKDAF
ncbi:MAG: dihydropyrimidine dehydrogenase [Alphaproteobacteria bacterium]|nr:dihydropyrimidine dehydrogenase [Alphaproteobacteria bacterium]